jgi:hypothetical protein
MPIALQAKTGSSELSMGRSGSVGHVRRRPARSAAGVLEISEPMSEATDLLDDQVDGFGAAIGYAAGVEEGEHLLAPGPGSPELSSSAATGHKWNPPVSDPWIRARSPRVLRCTTVTRVVDASGESLRVAAGASACAKSAC